MKYKKKFRLEKTNVKNKVVFLRLDLNVPVVNDEITSTKRIDAAIPTINYLLEHGAKVVILSHFRRIKTLDDVVSGKNSLYLVAKELANKLVGKTNKLTFIGDNKGRVVESEINNMNPGEVIVLENTRYNDVDENGHLINLESGCDQELSKYWASLCDVFCNDAFGTAHRKHASTYGIGEFAKKSCVGFLMSNEINTLSNVIDTKINDKNYISVIGDNSSTTFMLVHNLNSEYLSL